VLVVVFRGLSHGFLKKYISMEEDEKKGGKDGKA